MNNLINVMNQNGELLVSARELHKGLNISERFSSWFNRMLQYGFDENIDYVGCKVFNTLANQELQDYALKIDMAKEICMVQRSEEGKQFRRYFIECEKRLMAHALPVPEGPSLIGVDPCSNYLIRKNINQLDVSDIPRYVNQILEQSKEYKPVDRLNTYQLTRSALENLLPTLIESYDIALVRASLDKLNKLIENQKMYINRSKLGQATKKQHKLEETIRQYQLDSYDEYYYVMKHGFTVNCSYCGSQYDDKIHCTASYKKWKNEIATELENLPTLEEMGVDPSKPMKLDIYYYLKDETFDAHNCLKSFLDALEAHYKKEYPQFNDNMFADTRTRKYFSYAGSYDNGFIAFGIKNLTQDEIDELTFNE